MSEMSESKKIEAWAIKAPDGTINPDSISSSRVKAISSYNLMDGQGYRCVKVHITEAQE